MTSWICIRHNLTQEKRELLNVPGGLLTTHKLRLRMARTFAMPTPVQPLSSYDTVILGDVNPFDLFLGIIMHGSWL